jgi:hypothetical protein
MRREQAGMIDPNHPFYGPLWRRILIPAICFGWALFELYAGSVTWAVISAGLGLYAAYKLFGEKRVAPPVVTRDDALDRDAPVHDAPEQGSDKTIDKA